MHKITLAITATLLTVALQADNDPFGVQAPSVVLPTYTKPYKAPTPTAPAYYPTQTEPAPGVLYDYRTPSYDIYKYGRAPVRRR